MVDSSVQFAASDPLLRRVITKLESIEVKWFKKSGDEERGYRHFEGETNEGRFTGYLLSYHSYNDPNHCQLRVWLKPPGEETVHLYFGEFDEVKDKENWEFLESYFRKILSNEADRTKRYRDKIFG